MQKIIFLLGKKIEKEYYRFDAADYGPFSWQLSRDVDFLVSSGLLVQHIRGIADSGEKYEYALTKEGSETVRRSLAQTNLLGNKARILKWITELKQQNNHKNLKLLLRDVYSEYPEYAVKSRVVF